MSSCSKTTINCPKCGKSDEISIWHSLNATIDPEKKKELLSGTLTRFVCSSCQGSTDVAYPMLYNDMDNRVMLYYTAKKGDADPHDIPAGPLVQSYRLRLVSERNELIEKIHLTDVGIDDCAMELFKTALRDSLESKAEDQLYFSGLGKEGDTQQVMHFVLFTTQGTETLTIKRESFDELEKTLPLC